MKYVDKVLADGERVVYRAQIHWIVYSPVFLGFAAAAGAIVWAAIARPENWEAISVFIAIGFIILFPFLFLPPFIKRRTTELAVTDRRVIAKRGFIRRQTWEINNAKVEGVQVNQSVLGRLLGFGTVTVKGTGSGIAPINDVDDPLAFRSQVTLL